MVESIAGTSLLGQRPIYASYCCKDDLNKRKPSDLCRFPSTQFLGRGVYSSALLPRWCVRLPCMSFIKSQAMELTKEAYSFQEKERIPRDFRYGIHTGVDCRPGLWPPENKADDPALNNPLLRLERMGCGWLGAIFEWEGVLIEDNLDLEKQAWLALSQEEGKSTPPAFVLRRIEGMKNEQAIAEVLCWSRDPGEVKRMACRKEEIYQALHGGIYRFRSGSQEFVNVLMHYKVPLALVSTRPRKYLEKAIQAIGMEGIFNVIVAAEDVHRGKPDPEMFVYAAQLLQFIPERCIVFGNSNQTVEAAHDARMKCIAVASKHPVYELGAADLVVKHLDELSIIDLKNLAAVESAEFGSDEPELEMEPEEKDHRYPPSSVGVDDDFW
ncbi:UNVERIFIED_CONTAM: 5-amino-6-(5-phospho-D-ribitylamino)uracil phosphatase, chloroplastic [Sesamum radiatum]|uniref:5-amino-6-(5-phospho-D-ribitylamino)uracil phosphatase, chloroplastic n=1 Tax=Sesamum radiatum TaxID=300843 RepID=A0AAW2TUR1_SESRA